MSGLTWHANLEAWTPRSPRNCSRKRGRLGYENVSRLDPQTLVVFSGCGSGCLLAAVALGLGLVALGVRCPWPVVCSPVQFLFCGVQALERRETGLC